MKQIFYLCTIGFVLLAGVAVFCASADDLVETTHTITITSLNERISISERSTLKLDTGEIDFINVWVPSDATDIKVMVDDHLLQIENVDETTYQCNLSTIDLTNMTAMDVTLDYYLPSSSTTFSTTLLRESSSVTVRFNEQIIGSFGSVGPGVAISLPLTVVEAESSLFSIYIIILFVLLVIVVLVSVLFVMKKKQPSQDRTRDMESEDVLKTEYELLKEMLKQIEKYYRSQKIADETYHKLKGYYKQQAIDTMSALEKTGSKIKE
jgi:uncharacterized membrane protein